MDAGKKDGPKGILIAMMDKKPSKGEEGAPEDKEEAGEEYAADEAQVDAAADVRAALKGDDDEALAKALKAFVECC